MPFAEVPGARLHWRVDGNPDGPFLLMGNSLGTDQSLWDGVLPELALHFRVVRFDARGHGASVLAAGPQAEDASIALLACDALAVADAAGARRFHFLGLSIGGMIGLWLGQHAPERIDRLVLSNTAAWLPSAVWNERIEAVRSGGMAALVDATMQRWFTPSFAANHGALLAQTRDVFLRVDPRGYIACSRAIRDMDLRPELAQIRVPTLVLVGAADPATPPALGREIAANIPGAQCVELQGAHIPHLEHPGAFTAAVTEFLGRPAAAPIPGRTAR